HYRRVAQNSLGTTYGYDYTFSTVTAPVPASTVAPTLAGTMRIGNTLSTNGGNWNPAGTSYAYQWQRSTDGGATWTSIASATASTYTLAAGDVGSVVRVQVTATNSYGATAAHSVTSAAIAPGTPASTGAPTLAGTARVGYALSTNGGNWNPAGTSYAYQWQRSTDGGATWTSIASATASTYTLAAADLGAVLRVQVTATNSFGAASALSPTSPVVASGTPVSTAAPTLTGTAS